MKRVLTFVLTTVGAVLASPTGALGCAACFGQSDSNMAKSVNAGIFSLLAVVGTVLIGAASFFVFLSRRAAASQSGEAGQETP